MLGRSGPVRSVAVDFLPDNLHWTTDGAIIVAGQDSAAKAVTDCFFSTAATCGLDSGFARLRSEERRVGKECSVRVDLGGRRIIQKKILFLAVLYSVYFLYIYIIL